MGECLLQFIQNWFVTQNGNFTYLRTYYHNILMVLPTYHSLNENKSIWGAAVAKVDKVME
jgi:hypothetical protein